MSRWILVAGASALLLGLLAVTAGRPFRVFGAPGPRSWHVAAGASGDGPRARPFGRVADALALARAGDEVLLHPGHYRDAIASTHGGTLEHPLVIRALHADRKPILRMTGRVATLNHQHLLLQGLVLDSGFAPDDTVRVSSAATGPQLVDVEVGRSSRDCVDIDAPREVSLQSVRIHHCLNPTGGRADAHGVVAGAVEQLDILDSDISGEAVQADPGRRAPGWGQLSIRRSRLWLAPLPEPTNGFPAEAVPGENGIDTKTPSTGARGRVLVENVEASGFRDGLITNMACGTWCCTTSLLASAPRTTSARCWCDT